MKFKLLPSQFKIAGYSLMLIAAVLIIADHSGLLLNCYKRLYPHSLNSDGSFLLPTPYVKASFYINQLLPLICIAALLLIVFSGEQIEDEWIQNKRMISYKIAFFSVPVMTIVSLRFNDSTFLIFANLIVVWLIQICAFIYMVKIQPRFIKSN